MNFHSVTWVMPQGWDLGYVGVKSVRLSVTLSPPKPLDEFQPNLVCERAQQHIFGVLGVKSLIFPNMVMWHIKLKGVMCRTGHKIHFYPRVKLVTLGQIPLNFVESTGICDSAPSTAHSSIKTSIIQKHIKIWIRKSNLCERFSPQRRQVEIILKL